MLRTEYVRADDAAVPRADGRLGLTLLKRLARDRSLLAAMEVMHGELGDVFQITMPRFQPVVVSGHALNRQLLIEDRERLRWRGESDPVTVLLRHGLLVEDGVAHDRLRAMMELAMRRTAAREHIPEMIWRTDQILSCWPYVGELDMLVEMRKIALLVLLATLFGTDFAPQIEALWQPILKAIRFISPGAWIVWPNMPRPGYDKDLQKLDAYLYELISRRRREGDRKDDLLGRLIEAPDMTDELIRDQLLTMLIAGHDTSTAMLAWALYLLGKNPQSMELAEQEARQAGPGADLPFLNMVIKETLRLYPPIHVGNRFAAQDLQLQDCPIPPGTRVMISYYLSHRDPTVWEEPRSFCPHRFDRGSRAEAGERSPTFAYLPFGGGPRNCIGAAFAQIEGSVVLARILQQFELRLAPGQAIRPHMGATLEPRPGVRMQVRRRDG